MRVAVFQIEPFAAALVNERDGGRGCRLDEQTRGRGRNVALVEKVPLVVDEAGGAVAVEAIGEVGHELALEGEARAVVLAFLVVVNHVLEASALHERHPLCRLARLLQRLAPQERPPLPVLYAVLPQELQVQPLLVGVKVLVRCHIRQLSDSWV